MGPRPLFSLVVHSPAGLTSSDLAFHQRRWTKLERPAPLDDVGVVGHIQVSRRYAVPVFADGTADTRFSGRGQSTCGRRRPRGSLISPERTQLQPVRKSIPSRRVWQRMERSRSSGKNRKPKKISRVLSGLSLARD